MPLDESYRVLGVFTVTMLIFLTTSTGTGVVTTHLFFNPHRLDPFGFFRGLLARSGHPGSRQLIFLHLKTTQILPLPVFFGLLNLAGIADGNVGLGQRSDHGTVVAFDHPLE